MEDKQQQVDGATISRISKDTVFATEAMDSIGIHPAELRTDLQAVQKAHRVVTFFKGFENGISSLRSVVKGVPVKDRIQHLSEYVELKDEELSVRAEIDSLGDSKEDKVLKADLKDRLKQLVKDLKFYER